MSLKSFLDKLREEEKKRQQTELASLNTDVNVFKNKSSDTQNNTVKATAKSRAGTGGGISKVQSNTAKSSAKSTGRNTSKNKRNTDAIDRDWGLNAKAYGDMAVKPKKASVNKSADMINSDYGFNVKAMDDYLGKMKSEQKTEANKGAVIYDDVGDKIKDNKYADTMIKIGKSFSNFGKYNHLNDLYYINNPSGLDDGYKYINKDDMNKYFYLLASHEKGDVDKKDVDDLKHYLFRIGETIDAKDADELPPIENKPGYSKISSEEQLIYDSFENVVHKAKNIDYSDIPTDDQLPKEPGKIKVDKSTGAIDRDYGLDLSSYKDMNKIKKDDTAKPKRDIDYSKISSEEQLIYDSFGNAVNKAKNIDYSKIPTDDRLTDDATNKAIDKAKGIDYNKVYDSFGFEVPADYDKNSNTLSNIGKGIKESADWAEYGDFPDFTENQRNSNENETNNDNDISDSKGITDNNNINKETAASKEISLDNLSAINDVVGTTANLIDFKITGAVSDTLDLGFTLYKVNGMFKTSLTRQEALVSNAYNIGQYYYNLENNLPHENTFVLQPMKNVIVDKEFADSCKRFYENYFAYADYTHFNTNIANLSYDELSDKDKKNIINYSNTHTTIERYKYNEIIKPIGDFTVKQLYIMKFDESD